MIIYVVGVVSIILIGLSFVAANVVGASAVDCGSKAMDWWVVTSFFIESLAILALLIWFAVEVI